MSAFAPYSWRPDRERPGGSVTLTVIIDAHSAVRWDQWLYRYRAHGPEPRAMQFIYPLIRSRRAPSVLGHGSHAAPK